MLQLLEFIPIALFFIVYQLDGESLAIGSWSHTFDGIFSATWVLIIATCVQVAISALLLRKLEKRAVWTLVAILLFGGATLVLRDQTFIQWKPTIFNWVLALVFIGFHFTDRNLMQRTLGKQLHLPNPIWSRLNLLWIGNFAIVGALNLWVAYSFSEAVWVSYKLYSAIGFTVVLTIITALIISPHVKEAPATVAGEDS